MAGFTGLISTSLPPPKEKEKEKEKRKSTK